MNYMLKLRSSASTTIACWKAGSASAGSASPTSACRRVWLWAVTIHLPGGLPTGSSPDFNTAKVEFKAAWEVLKASTPPSLLATAYKAMILRGDND